MALAASLAIARRARLSAFATGAGVRFSSGFFTLRPTSDRPFDRRGGSRGPRRAPRTSRRPSPAARRPTLAGLRAPLGAWQDGVEEQPFRAPDSPRSRSRGVEFRISTL